MRLRSLTFWLLMLCLGTAQYAFADDPCSAVLAQGIFNQSLYSSSASYKQTVDDFIYASNFRTHDEAIGAGLSVGFPVYGVPIQIGGTFSDQQRDTWRNEYLQTHSGTIDQSAAVQSFQSNADPGILNAWLGCQGIKNAQGLQAGIRPIGTGSVYFWIRYIPAGANDSPKIASIQLTGLKSRPGGLAVGQAISLANGGSGSFYDVTGTSSVVGVNVTTKTPDRGGVAVTYDYGAHNADVTQRQINQALSTAGYIVGEIRILGFGPLSDDLRKAGWIECDGRSLANADYPELFKAIGNTWGTDTPSIAFKVPDLRGFFLRGWDHGAGRDPSAGSRLAIGNNAAVGDAVGSREDDQFRSHHHTITQIPQISSFPEGDADGGSHMGETNSRGGWSTDDAGGPETRPINANVMFAIYSGRPGK